MKYNIEVGGPNLWCGIYYETWPKPYRRDIWISIFILSLHIIQTKAE